MCQDVLVVMNRKYNLKWLKTLVLKLGDILELSGEFKNTLEMQFYLQR